MTAETSTERRATPRQKSTLNRFLMAQLAREGQEARDAYVFLLDLSEGGMRLHLDWEIPGGETFELKFPVDSFGANLTGELNLRLEVIWSRALVGGTVAHGLQFVDASAETRATILQMMEHFEEEGGHELFPLDEALPLTVTAYGQEHPTVARKLSRAGLAFRTRVPLKTGDHIGLALRLGATFGSLRSRGRVALIQPLDDELHEVRCEFLELSPEEAQRITAFIDQSGRHKRQQSGFSWEPPDSRKHLH